MRPEPKPPRVSDELLDLNALIAETDGPGFGAMVLFTGSVRAENDGKEVTGMEYSAHEMLAERVLANIETRAEAAHPGTRVSTRHRLGDLAVGEISVAVLARAPHRAEAFDAARLAIEALKVEAPVFKLERYADGSKAYLDGRSLQEEAEEEDDDEGTL